MNSTSVIFNADTGEYITQVEGMEKATVKVAQSVADTKNKIAAYGKQQVDSAQAAGKSATELEKIWTRTSQSIANVTEKNAAQMSRSIDGLIEKNKRLAASQKDLGNIIPFPVRPPGVESEHNDITNKQRASALLRGGGLRAGENFAAQFDIFNKVASIAFPVLGAVTLAKAVYDGVNALKEMYDTAQKLPEALRLGFDSINAPIGNTADGLRKANAELKITIAHLEHRSGAQGGLALELAEARINADNLAESARKAQIDVEKLLKENGSGFFQRLFLNKGETGPISDEVNKRMGTLADLQDANREAVRSGKDTAPAQAARDNQLRAAKEAFRTYIRDKSATINGTEETTISGGLIPTLGRKSYASIHGDQASNNNILRGARSYLDNEDDVADQRAQNIAEQKTEKQDRDRTKVQQDAAEAARKALEAQHKAAEAQYKGMENSLSDRRSIGDVSKLQEYEYWEGMLEPARRFPENLSKVKGKIGELYQELGREINAELAAAVAKQQRSFEALAAADRTLLDVSNQWERSIHRGADAVAELYAVNQRNTDALAEQALAQEVATGAISKHDAAVRLATLHATTYAAQLEALNQDKTNDDNDASLSKEQRGANQSQRNVKAATINGEAARAAFADNLNITVTTYAGALKAANGAWVANAKDGAKEVAEIYREAIDGLNDNLSDLLIGKKANFAGLFQGLGKTLATDGLKSAEAPVLGALGLGKPDGSDSNPYSVKVIGGSGGPLDGAKMGTSALGKLLYGVGKKGSSDDGDDDGDDDSSGSSSGFGKVVSFLGGLFGGGFALGGDVKPGVPIDVGEMGRERFVPSVPGKIVPNNQLGGSTAYYTVNVGEGVTGSDVDMRINSALRKVHPQVSASSVAAMKDDRRRMPQSKG